SNVAASVTSAKRILTSFLSSERGVPALLKGEPGCTATGCGLDGRRVGALLTSTPAVLVAKGVAADKACTIACPEGKRSSGFLARARCTTVSTDGGMAG